jgi:hypothetical protein
VPLVSPEKNASAIEQKKMLPADTSVKGSVMLAPPQVPVSACNRLDSTVTLTIIEMRRLVRMAMLALILMISSFLFNQEVRLLCAYAPRLIGQALSRYNQVAHYSNAEAQIC